MIVSAYLRSFFSDDKRPVNIASARAGNVIGGGDWANDRLIPDLFRSFTQGKPALVRNPAAIRPWQHVLEPLSGYLQLAEQLSTHTDFSGGWNFGPDTIDAKPVEWIANYIRKLWGDGASWQYDAQHHPHEAGILHLDCSKARTLLGWAPKLHIADALELTTLWYKAHADGEDMHAYTLQQLNNYHTKETT